MDNGRQPATKQDLSNLKKELQEASKQDLANLKEQLAEAIHDSGTRLLRAFCAVAEPIQKHLTDLDHSQASLCDRFGALENRVIEIEERLNMPPQT